MTVTTVVYKDGPKKPKEEKKAAKDEAFEAADEDEAQP